MKQLSLVCILFSLANVATAETTAIVGATVHTVGPQGTVENATIIIVDSRIVSVDADSKAPDGATLIDASGKVVTPGLFSPAGYLGLVEVGFSAGPLDAVQRGNRFTASFDVADAFNPHSTLIAVNRVEGVTRALTMPRGADPDEQGNVSHVISGMAAVVNLSGGTNSLDRRAAALVVNLGEAGIPFAGTSRVSALLVLKNVLDEALDYREHGDAHERGQHRDYTLSVADLVAMQAVISGDIPLLVNVDRASDIDRLIAIVRKYRIRAVISGGAEAWMRAGELAAENIAVILSPGSNLPVDFDHINVNSRSAAILAAAGVKIAFADGDSHTHNARNITQSAGNASVDGLSWDAALRAITLSPAEIYGVAARVGSIEPGKDADIVIWPGDPLELSVYPDYVMIMGESMPLTSRQTLLRDRYMSDPDIPPAYRN